MIESQTRAGFNRVVRSMRRLTTISILSAGFIMPGAVSSLANDDPALGGGSNAPFVPGFVELSRINYDGNSFGSSATYPFIFNDPNVSGVQGSIHIDQYQAFKGAFVLAIKGLTLLNTAALSGGISTSFSSKSEGSLSLSPNGSYLGYIGYQGPVGAEGVSNSETPGATLTTNTAPTYDRDVALLSTSGSAALQPETNAYSGDNPRAAITTDGSTIYMAGNSDSALNKDRTGPGTTIGARIGTIGSDLSTQLGVYFASDRPDESTTQHIKDNNFRSIGIFNGNLYVAKGSGGNGDDGVFQVQNGTGNGLPTGTGNTIVPLFSAPATDPNTGAPSPYTPFGFWFANPTTLYVADEGYANTDSNGNLIVDPLAGLEKWILVQGKWQLAYTLQTGLVLAQPQNITGYPVPTATTGIRNLTGVVNPNNTATIYAITAQNSSISGGEPDPTKLVAVVDAFQATKLPPSETFVTLKTSRPGEVFRGVAFAPCGGAFNFYNDPNFATASACP